MPAPRADDNRRVRQRAILTAKSVQLRLRLAERVLLHALPLAVLSVERPGKLSGAGFVGGGEQFERGLRRAEPPGGVETRPQPVANVHRTHRRLDPGNLHQCPHARAFRAGEFLAASPHEDAVFLH